TWQACTDQQAKILTATRRRSLSALDGDTVCCAWPSGKKALRCHRATGPGLGSQWQAGSCDGPGESLDQQLMSALSRCLPVVLPPVVRWTAIPRLRRRCMPVGRRQGCACGCRRKRQVSGSCPSARKPLTSVLPKECSRIHVLKGSSV